jgi:hypothetical protein
MSGASFSPDDAGPSLVPVDGNPIMVRAGTEIVSVSGDLTGTPPFPREPARGFSIGDYRLLTSPEFGCTEHAPAGPSGEDQTKP